MYSSLSSSPIRVFHYEVQHPVGWRATDGQRADDNLHVLLTAMENRHAQKLSPAGL